MEPRTVERRTAVVAPLSEIQVRDSGAGDGSYTIRGHAAVFNRLSLDLGGFQEKIAPGAFTNALDRSPDVLAVWDHDTSLTLARTLNGTLELRQDPMGLHMWARVAPTSYAADLRVLMERGDISQASFMFTIAQERAEWSGDDADPIIFTVEEIGDLYDVTVTGRGAYPQTDTSVVAHSRMARVEKAIREGDLPERARALVIPEPATAEVGNEEPEGTADGDSDGAAPSQVDPEARERIAQAHRKALAVATRTLPKE